jgi:hypothetical protein
MAALEIELPNEALAPFYKIASLDNDVFDSLLAAIKSTAPTLEKRQFAKNVAGKVPHIDEAELGSILGVAVTLYLIRGKSDMPLSPERVAEGITSSPLFAESGKFSPELRKVLSERLIKLFDCDKSIGVTSEYMVRYLSTAFPKLAINSSELEKEFDQLATKWYRETGMISMIHKKSMHPAYQRIIGMGKDALPFIFKELQKKSGHWLWALCAITGEDPAEGMNKFAEAVNAWLEWGKKNGYV